MGVAVPHHIRARGAGAEDGLGSGKDPEKVAHKTPGRGRVACGPGKLAAAGLVLGVLPGHVKAIQKPGHGTGRLRGALVQEAGDKELDNGFPFKCYVSIIEPFDISVLSNRKPKTAFDPRHLLLPLFYHKAPGRGKRQGLRFLLRKVASGQWSVVRL